MPITSENSFKIGESHEVKGCVHFSCSYDTDKLCLSSATNASGRCTLQVIESAEKDCTDYVLNTSKASQAKNITGKYSLDGAFTQTIRKGIPYAKSTYLDNGVEGSAWRACMKG